MHYKVLAAVAAAALLPAQAATSTFTGPGIYWYHASNWQPPEVPAPGNDIVFQAHGDPQRTVSNLLVGVSVGSLDFQGSYYLGGYPLSVTGPIHAVSGHVTLAAEMDFGAAAVTVNTVAARPPWVFGIRGSGEVTFTQGARLVGGGHLAYAGLIRGSVTLDDASIPQGRFSGTSLVGRGTLGDVQVSGTLSPGLTDYGHNGVGLLKTGNLISTGVFAANLRGAAGGVGHDQVRVTGTVQVGGALEATLDVAFTPAPGEIYTLVDNDGADAVTGSFDGLPEGAAVTLGAHQFRVSYTGGDGNDITLTALTGEALDAPSVSITAASAINDNLSRSYQVIGECNLPGRVVRVSFGGVASSGVCGVYATGLYRTDGVSVTALPDGDVTIVVTHGMAGGPSTQATTTVAKDTQSPALAFTQLPPITEANITSYSFTIACEPGPFNVTWHIMGPSGWGFSGEAACPAGGALQVSGQDLRNRLPDGTVTASAEQYDSIGNRAYVEQSVSKAVNRQAQVIDFPALADRPYSPQSFIVVATGGGSGNLVFFEAGPSAVCTASALGTLVMNGAGTCTVTATQAGGELHLPATPVQRSFVISKVAQALSLQGLADVVAPYVGPIWLATSTPSSAGSTYESLTPAICAIENNATIRLTGTLGTCQVRATNPGDSRYLPATAVGSFQVLPPPTALSISATAIDFGGQSINTTSAERTITVTNGTEGRLFVYGIAIAAPFGASHDCWDIAPSGTCTVRLAFTPGAEGLAIQIIALNHNRFGSTTSITLQGTGERSLVRHFYSAILGRAADPAGHEYWTAEAARLQALGANMNEAWFAMALGFFNSPEYTQSQPLDLDFLADLYLTFFNRAPDGAGLAYWTSLLQQGLTRDNVLQSFLFSPEFDAFTRAIFGNQSARAEAEMLMDFYRGTMGRLPDSAGYNFWLGRLRTAQCTGAAAVAAEAATITQLFLTSPEYVARGRTDAEYVSDLYNTFMRRGGDLAGQQFWVGQLGAGVTRDAVRVAFIGSPEFQARVQAVIAAGCFR